MQSVFNIVLLDEFGNPDFTDGTRYILVDYTGMEQDTVKQSCEYYFRFQLKTLIIRT